MIPLLPAVLLSLLPSLSDGQELSQERVLAGESVGEILQALEEKDGNAPELWWALFERDERSPEVLDAMRHWLHRTIHAESRRVIDTVLNHWQVPHRAISREEFLDRSWELVEPEEALPWKVAPLSGTNAELVELLSTPEERLRMRAAFTLLCRGIHQLDATSPHYS